MRTPIEHVLAMARAAVCEPKAEADLYDVATALLQVIPGVGVEERIAGAEGIMDALSGRPYLDDYGVGEDGADDLEVRQALAYCAGFCLVAPGFGHAESVHEILEEPDR